MSICSNAQKSPPFPTTSRTKTVAVLGGSYGGHRAVQVLADGLPHDWRIVLIDRNSHLNHVYTFSRYAVLPGHEHKAFIPYSNLFPNSQADSPSSSSHARIQATVTSIDKHRITLSSNLPDHEQKSSLDFDYAIYALGSHLPSPIDLRTYRDECGIKPTLEPPGLPTYGATKSEGVSALQDRQKRIEAAPSVLVVGGGALGIQFASDIAAVYPQKHVTLLHSRRRLLPRFDDAMHEEALQGLQELNVNVILGERLDFESLQETFSTPGTSGPRVVRTISGLEISSDLLLLCTGQIPNTGLLRDMDPRSVVPETGLASVLRTMQLYVPERQEVEADVSDVLNWLKNTSFSLAQDTELAPSPPPTPSVDITSTPCSPRTPCSLYSPALSSTGTLVEPEPSHETIYPNIFVVGDAADAFNAIKAGHTAYYQAEVAARNIIRLIRREEKAGLVSESESTSEPESESESKPGSESKSGPESKSEEEGSDFVLEEYAPGPPAIKVTLGLTKSVYEVDGTVGTRSDGVEDLSVAVMWAACGMRDVSEEDMFA